MMRIEHVAMWVKDLEVMRSFYEKYFGAIAGEKYHNERADFTSYFLAFGTGCRLELMHKPSIVDNHDALHIEFTGIVHFAISLGEPEKVDALTDQLRLDGFSIVREPRTTGDGYYESVILDPEGNKVELTI
jgi:lactoylglutathione lyase